MRYACVGDCFYITVVNVQSTEFPNSPRGNHVLALINTMEDYDH